MKDVLKKLEARGVVIIRDYEYVDTPKGRVKQDLERIKFVRVPLTPAEWFSLCTRGGAHYIGGCCGQTGYTQDILNQIFREGGDIEDYMAHDLRQTAGGHDGFELLAEADEKKLLEAEAGWEELDPIDKIFLCVAAIYPYLQLHTEMPRKVDLKNPKDIVYALHSGARYLDWTDLFDKVEGREEDPAQIGQKHANNAMVVARLVPAAQAFLEHAKKLAAFPWEGFAILGENDEPVSTPNGSSLFLTRKAAEDLLETWRRSKDDVEDARKSRIVPVRISVEKGLEIVR